MPADSGFRASLRNASAGEPAVVIIGAGISGICMAIDLIKRNACSSFVILEKGSGVGGTWNDNRYPGCCCDVWGSLYSYSFEQKPDWSREYPGQEEILAYLIRVAEKYGLYRYIRFNQTVQEAQWDAAESKWRISVNVSGGKDREFAESYTISSDFLVSAVGQLNLPQWPAIPGLREFQGKTMHSARWDWNYDPKGKRVAIIGNGATAVQIAPELAKTASHLTVYQRTPNWVIPRNDAQITAFEKALLTYIPPIRWLKRSRMMNYRENFHSAVTEGDSALANDVRRWCQDMLKEQLGNKPELWDKLTPNYSPGCKRVIISDDYYPALGRENVDLETREITRVAETGIEVDDGSEQQFDLIVLATGFRAVEFLHPIRVSGDGGRHLADVWKNGATAYFGMTVEDMPNFAMFYGPNTNLGHNSIILMIEAQSRYLSALVEKVLEARERGKTVTIKPKPAVLNKHNVALQDLLQKSSFADPNCSSWYKTNTGKITNNWAGTVIDYQSQLSQVQWDDYIVGGNGKLAIRAKMTTSVGRVREETAVTNTTTFLAILSVLIAIRSYLATASRHQ